MAQKTIQKIQAEKIKVRAYHINRLIQINNKYPNKCIEEFLLEHIGEERNNSDAKITQPYLIKEISKLLQEIPQNLCE